MPWTTVAIVFGSWVVLLLLTLVYYFVWSRKRDGIDGKGE